MTYTASTLQTGCMPYGKGDKLPSGTRKNLTKKGDRIVKAVINKKLAEGSDEGEAFAIAQAAAKKAKGGYTKKARKRLGGKSPAKKKIARKKRKKQKSAMV